jgi:deazaflavin-dependent oxidoreductase (nitroreductase family)
MNSVHSNGVSGVDSISVHDILGSKVISEMVAVKKKRMLWYLFRTPIYIYRWHLEWLFGKRLLLLTHTGRRSGLRRQTVLEVVEYRREGPEVVVANGFGPDSDWLRNIQAKSDEEVKVWPWHFAASHRFLSEDEAVKVMEQYEHRNRFIAPILRAGFTWLLGWRYSATESDRRRLVRQIPLLAFRPRFGSTG